MKIAFIGDNSGGQFYPIIAIAEQVFEQSENRHLVVPKIYYLAHEEYNPVLLFNSQMSFIKINQNTKAVSSINFFTYIKNIFGIIGAFLRIFALLPDVILTKGGQSNFSLLVAARLLGIPIMIHESDSVASPINIWASRFAKKVAVSYKTTAESFPLEKTAHVGQPIRKDIIHPLYEGAREYLKLEQDTPVILVLGGTKGSSIINDTIVNSLPLLLDKYQIVHQTGKESIASMRDISKVVLRDNENAARYHPYSYLDDLAIRMAAGSSTLAISHAGGVMFELSAWGLPAIIIPSKDSALDHERRNAFSYARIGGAEVIEEINLTPHLLVSEIDRLVQNENLRNQMKKGASEFHHPDAAIKIAGALLDIAISHER